MAESNPVVIASDQSPIPVVGSISVDTSLLAKELKQDSEISQLSAILAKIIAAPATESTVSAIESTLSGINFATQTTLAAVLAKIIAAPATEAKQDTGNTSLATIAGKDFSTQTTLVALLTANHTDLAAILTKLNGTVNVNTGLVQSLTDIQLRATPVPVSGSVTVTGGGDASAANQNIGNASVASIDGKTPALGQALAASSVPVVLTAAQLTTLTPLTSVAVNNFPATQPISAASLPLPSGAASAANQATGNASLASIDSKLTNPIPVSVASLPLPSGASTAANQATANALLTDIDALLTSPLVISGSVNTDGVTDTQLRASPVPVTFLGAPSIDNTILYNSTINTVGAIGAIDTTGYASIIAQINGTWAGNIIFEGSNDSTIWDKLLILDLNELSMQDIIYDGGIFQIKASTKYIRLNLTQLQTGIVSAVIIGRTVSGSNGADLLSFAMDKGNNTPLYVEEVRGNKKDVQNALIPSDAPAPIYSINAVTTGVIMIVDTTGYQSISLQSFGTFSASIVTQLSNDGINWVATSGIFVTTSAGGGITQSAITATGQIFLVTCSTKYFRLVVSAYTSGVVQIVAHLRQQAVPGNPAFSQPVNITNVSGINPGLAASGILAVGGSVANAIAPNANPNLIAGIDTTNLTRRILTDVTGRLITTQVATDPSNTVRPIGILPSTTNTFGANSLIVTETALFEGQNHVELLAQILLELKINNQLLSELPTVLNTVNGRLDDPAVFRNDQSIFTN